MPQLWEPKDLLKAMKDHDEVNLRHIATRRDKGLLEPDVKAERPGERTKYGSFNALLYVVATKFEKAGFSIEAAYESAKNILSNDFISCLTSKDYLWLIEVNSNIFFTLNNKSCDLPSEFITQRKSEVLAINPPEAKRAIDEMFGDKDELPPQLNIDDFVKLIPANGVFLFVKKAFFDQLPEIETIRYHNASRIVLDSVRRLEVNGEEIMALERDCRRNNHIRNFGTNNIEGYDFD